jgi:hypothetical protein
MSICLVEIAMLKCIFPTTITSKLRPEILAKDAFGSENIGQVMESQGNDSYFSAAKGLVPFAFLINFNHPRVTAPAASAGNTGILNVCSHL